MQIEQIEALWLHEHNEFTLRELAELSGLSEESLRDWVDEGILVPIDPQAAQWTFGADRLVILQKLYRLRKDFDVEPRDLALVITLLQRVQSLEAEVRELRAKLPRVFR